VEIFINKLKNIHDNMNSNTRDSIHFNCCAPTALLNISMKCRARVNGKSPKADERRQAIKN
jgi:hypothetical protein